MFDIVLVSMIALVTTSLSFLLGTGIRFYIMSEMPYLSRYLAGAVLAICFTTINHPVEMIELIILPAIIGSFLFDLGLFRNAMPREF